MHVDKGKQNNNKKKESLQRDTKKFVKDHDRTLSDARRHIKEWP